MSYPLIHPANLSVMKLSPDAVLPTRAHADDAGMDLYGLEDVLIGPGQGLAVRTGIAMAIPTGYVGLVADRSSLGKKGIKTAGGVIDAGYRGEVQVILWNLTREEVRLSRGDRIAQLLIFPVAAPAIVEVSRLDQTTRGTGGFGSTGK